MVGSREASSEREEVTVNPARDGKLSHDSGASAPKKKPSRRKLMKRLNEALEKNSALQDQISQMEAEPVLNQEIQPTSEILREEPGGSRNDSLLVSTMNSWTLGTLNIPECVPSEGETEIDKRAFEYWKDVFNSSVQLIKTADEHTKYGLFKIKAGPKLREILSTTASSPEMPSEVKEPFSNAMARLNEYFGSRTYLLAQRGKLMNMSQLGPESSIQFVRRVCSAAKLCDYNNDEEMEAVVRVMTKGASDSRVRALAHRNWVKQGSMKDLIDQIRDREIEKSNEEEFLKSRGSWGATSGPASIAAVFQPPTGGYGQRQTNFRPSFSGYRREWSAPRGGFGAQRGGFGAQRGGFGAHRGGRGRGDNRMVPRSQPYSSATNCWRCGSVFHSSERCPNATKECYICGRIGHIQSQCSQPREQSAQPRPLKRRGDHVGEQPASKIAIVEKQEGEVDKVESDSDAS